MATLGGDKYLIEADAAAEGGISSQLSREKILFTSFP